MEAGVTKKQRECVVELLRCGADLSPPNILTASVALGYGDDVRDPAYLAFESANEDIDPYWLLKDTYRISALEAALRVESGEWP